MATKAAKAVYVYADNFYSSVPAAVVGATVNRVVEREGVCTAQRLVDEARPDSSPLHPGFNWDDETAAEAYRREQARLLIRSVRVQVEDRPESAPTFVRVQGVTDEGGWSGYKPLSKLTVDERSQVEREALGMLNALRRRYSSLQRLESVWAAIDEATAE